MKAVKLIFVAIIFVAGLISMGKIDKKNKIQIPKCSKIPEFEESRCVIPPPSKLPPLEL